MLLLGSQGHCSGLLNDESISSGEQIVKLQHLQSALRTILVITLLSCKYCTCLQNPQKPHPNECHQKSEGMF